jgi:hypothetical protein
MGDDKGQPSKTSKRGDYEIGYRKPPSDTRFKKGRSGNPAGRRHGSKNFSTMLDEELEQRVIIRENGRQKTITKRRASMRQLVNKAASGEQRALQTLFNYLYDLERRAASGQAGWQLDDTDREVAESEALLERLDEKERLELLALLNRARGGPEIAD